MLFFIFFASAAATLSRMAEASDLRGVTTSPKAFCTIALHASSFKHQAIHGLLLGNTSKQSVEIQEAVPVLHGVPTKPLVEIALGLVESKTELSIVGWYTAPELLEDTRASPAALRMTSALAVNNIEPTLIVVQNKGLSEVLKGNSVKAEGAIQAFGKDFGGQYLESVPTKVKDSDKASKAAAKAYANNVHVTDFVEHLEGEPSDPWFPSPEISKLII